MNDPQLTWAIAAAVGQIAGAIATFAAVAVSLWIVLTERREHLTLVIDESLIIGGGVSTIKVIAFRVTNTGLRSVRINTFGWRVGWSRRGPKWLRYQWAMQLTGNTPGSSEPPFDLAPGRSAAFLIDIENLLGPDRDSVRELFAKRKMPFFGFVAPRILGVAHTAMGKTFAAKPDQSLRSKLMQERTLEAGLDSAPMVRRQRL